MISREIKSIPFEDVAIDLVGPFEKGRGGCRYLLTYICMASRWPEATPLKSFTARAVADGLLEIFSRNGVPLQILSNQRTQLTGALMSEICAILGVVKIRTTPYRPQSNGVVEHLHGALVPMIRKTLKAKLDWVKQVLLALYAIRLAPNSSTGISPFEFIHGRAMHSPLDLLYEGLLGKDKECLNVSAWVAELADRLDIIRDIVYNKQVLTASKHKDT